MIYRHSHKDFLDMEILISNQVAEEKDTHVICTDVNFIYLIKKHLGIDVTYYTVCRIRQSLGIPSAPDRLKSLSDIKTKVVKSTCNSFVNFNTDKLRGGKKK